MYSLYLTNTFVARNISRTSAKLQRSVAQLQHGQLLDYGWLW